MLEPLRTQQTRPTIGLLTDIDGGALNEAMWAGVDDLTQARDVNLICFSGNFLPAAQEVDPNNILYELIGQQSLDGLIIWGGLLAHCVGQEAVRVWCRRYEPLPLVSIALQMEGIPSVMVDNYRGMREVVDHLIKVHGHRRVAFLRGPSGHQEAEARYQAYLDSLAEHEIPFDASLIQFGDFNKVLAEKATHLLLDTTQGNFEALVAADDEMAIGALRALQARGLHVPEDMALTGFDNIKESQLVTPPLTTVPFLMYEQGRQAADMLLSLLVDRVMPTQVSLPTRLIVRQSCGCAAPPVVQAATDPQMETTKPGEIWLERIRGIYPTGVEQLLDAFQSELKGKTPGAFLSQLGQAVTTGGEVEGWQDVLSMMRRHCLPYLTDRHIQQRAEDLWHQARVMIGEMAQRIQAYQKWHTEEQARALRTIGQRLTTTLDIAELMNVLVQELPQLGLRSCFLSLYETPQTPAEGAKLILAYNEQQQIQLESGGDRFPTPQLVPAGLLPQNRRYHLAAEPLFFRDEQLGFVLFEAGPQEEAICQALREILSGALKDAQLYGEALAARALAEKADQLKTRLLANVSHELRTPLQVILSHTQAVLDDPLLYGRELPAAWLQNLHTIQVNAEHQIRVINDLLDLSRAEIDELDLYPELIDLSTFLAEVFDSIASGGNTSPEVTWYLELPECLPALQADPVRLRQILFNLLSNARKFTRQGRITLGAGVTPPYVHLWVQDTGCGIPGEMQERIFEPFVTAESAEGIGLGLTITRRLVALHQGSIRLESQPGQGSIFHIYLPLPNLSDQPASVSPFVQPVLLLISSLSQPAPEIVAFSQRQGLEIRRITTTNEVETLPADLRPTALAWDLGGVEASSREWAILQRLRKHPFLSRAPFILLYGQKQAGDSTLAPGIMNLMAKPLSGKTLLEAIQGLQPASNRGPILIVDDEAEVRDFYHSLIAKELPAYRVRTASDGQTAVRLLSEETPGLVILDLLMPEMDGFEVLEWLRLHPQNRHVPVLVLSNRPLTFDDVKRLELHNQVTVQSKGILSPDETIEMVQRLLLGSEALSPQTSVFVKRAVAYFHQNYQQTLSRQEMAEALGVNEDYLSRVFRQELGLSPWEYLNRYRIKQAKELLFQTDDSITIVAHTVGFKDSAYFCRVFHKLVGRSPRAYREQPKTLRM